MVFLFKQRKRTREFCKFVCCSNRHSFHDFIEQLKTLTHTLQAFQFPETAKILHKLRKEHMLFEGTPFGFCFFSNLHGQSSIEAHTSPMNLRLRIHLPLSVPDASENEQGEPDCAIRVGSMTRTWTQDKAMVLDDSYNHQVWNRTDDTRLLLLVDIWHPDVTLAEKKNIVEMFQEARQQGMWKR
jgi:hypothetical protein